MGRTPIIPREGGPCLPPIYSIQRANPAFSSIVCLFYHIRRRLSSILGLKIGGIYREICRVYLGYMVACLASNETRMARPFVGC